MSLSKKLKEILTVALADKSAADELEKALEPAESATSGEFDLVWVTQANAPILDYPTNPICKWTKVGSLITIEIPEMRMLLENNSDTSFLIPEELVPATQHPDGIQKGGTLATNNGLAGLYLDGSDPANAYLQIVPIGFSAPVNPSKFNTYGGSITYHLDNLEGPAE